MLAQRTEEALAKAGWTDSRNISIADDLRQLRAEGYEPWPALLEFLASFTDIALELRRKDQRADFIWFSGPKAVESTFRETVEEYERRLGIRLVPVGSAHSDHLIVLAAKDGGFYVGYDDYLACAGRDIDEMLNTFVMDEPFSVVL